MPNISWADLGLCGVDTSQFEFQNLLECKRKERYQSSSETLKCYGKIFSEAKKGLGSKTVEELSPLARDLLSIIRSRYEKGDEENKFLSFYETTELHRVTKKLAEKGEVEKGFIEAWAKMNDNISFEQARSQLTAPALKDLAKKALPRVEKLQTYHYIFFNSIGEINYLTKGHTPLVSIKELKAEHRPKRSYENEPNAFKDCRYGILPAHYPPPYEIERVSKRKAFKKDNFCPDWIGEFNLNCDPKEGGPFTNLSPSFIKNSLFSISIEAQIKGLYEHISLGDPKVYTKKYKKDLKEKIHQSLELCYENLIEINGQEEPRPLLHKKDINKELDKLIKKSPAINKDKWQKFQKLSSKDMAQSIRQLALLKKYHQKTNFKVSSMIQAHKNKCIRHPFNTDAGYGGLAIYSKSNETGSLGDKCTRSAESIRAYHREFVAPIEEQISFLRNRQPALGLPIAGGKFGSSKCLAGVFDKATERPLDYFIYGKFSIAKRAQELQKSDDQSHLNQHCGEPLWLSASKKMDIGYPNIENKKEHYDQLSDLVSISKKKSTLKLAEFVEDEFDPENTDAEIHHLNSLISSIKTEASPSEKDIELISNLSNVINEGIEEKIISGFQESCNNPEKYKDLLLASDEIGKLLFATYGPDTHSKKVYCKLRHNYLKDKAASEKDMQSLSVGVGLLGFIHPMAALAVLPFEFGLEYKQWKDMTAQKKHELSLAIMGLEDFKKADRAYETLKKDEMIFYGMIGLMALGGIGDAASLAGDGLKLFSKGISSKKLKTFDKQIDNVKLPSGFIAEIQSFNRKINKLNTSLATDIEKRAEILSEYQNLKRKFPGPEAKKIFKTLDQQLAPITELMKRDVKIALSKDLLINDLGQFISDLDGIEDMDFLLAAYKKIQRMNPAEKQKFIAYLKRRSLSCEI
ncbi:MAG: hypothetical protein CME61_06140 [Halobacteriovoraceae bacterium]|nr:hypothetical protein [Halobacteriovoraceae bacterium]